MLACKQLNIVICLKQPGQQAEFILQLNLITTSSEWNMGPSLRLYAVFFSEKNQHLMRWGGPASAITSVSYSLLWVLQLLGAPHMGQGKPLHQWPSIAMCSSSRDGAPPARSGSWPASQWPWCPCLYWAPHSGQEVWPTDTSPVLLKGWRGQCRNSVLQDDWIASTFVVMV